MNASASAAQIDDLESVINTEELTRRPSRAPDYAAESSILESLAQGMAHSPELVLQDLARAALKSCQAGSAGISLIDEDGKHVRWHALAGELASHRIRSSLALAEQASRRTDEFLASPAN